MEASDAVGSPEPSEIRATEESKGGMKYELVLADPCIESPIPKTTPKSLSAEDIDKKLKEAEERRQTLEALKLNSINEKLTRLVGVNQKKEESKQEFQEATRLSVLKKMETTEERRDAHIRSIQDKLREHGSHIQEVRKSLDAQSQEILSNLQKKLDSAAELRESQIGALQDRLKNHDAHIAEVRKQLDAQVEERRDNLQKKLETAQEKRCAIYKELQERLQEKEKHAQEVRQNKAVQEHSSG
ncbi:stathmin-4-like isoform X2 [Ornithodoros turicata]|uniref:stathmin-4-like isoform X2 n=1 Tax=Ornithodoros turicata TaxID=34597 RepID=UPI00313898DC